jgi:hypothetical protein
MPDDEVRDIADAVSRYLELHPGAADTPEGIVRWWLPRLCFDETIANVQRALEWLVDQGVVAKSQMPDGRYVYARSHGRSKSHN